MGKLVRKYKKKIQHKIHSQTAVKPRLRPQKWGRYIINSELQNFYKVDNNLYRSEQPMENCLSELKTFGISDILNLRQHHSDEHLAKEFNLHSLKLRTGGISEQQIIDALNIINNVSGSILIHCWHGSDRTGTIIAAYRMVFQNWSKKQAIDEFVNGGYGFHAIVYGKLVKKLNKLDIEHIKSTLPNTSN
jgi:protein tyrosine/serine phosphatase